MGDLSLEACQAKCEELSCSCFDFAGASANKAVRKGEHCRICKQGALFLPLQSSTWGYEAVVSTPNNWGATFLLLVAGLSCTYFGGGYVHNSRTRGATGMHALPHARHWVELHGLVSDGVAFAKHGGRARPGGYYRPVERVATSKPGREKETSRAGGGSPAKAGKASQKKEKKAKKSTAADSGSAPTPPAAAAQPVTSAPAPAPAVGTASGGGGRWVHVPT
jgi:hypothetical protein